MSIDLSRTAIAGATTIPPTPRVDTVRRAVFAVLGVLGALLAGYVIWLVSDGSFHYSVLWNGWIPDGFEFVVALCCVARSLVHRPGRAVALILGCALLSWCFGDTVWTVQSVVGETTATKILGPGFWLGFYPLAYVALVLFMRKNLRSLTAPGLLDGIVAALGAAAVCAAFAFRGVTPSYDAGALTKATNLAYPIGDLLLLALVVGGMAMLSGRRTAPWVVLAAACLLNCVGDTINLFQPIEDHLRRDTVFHALAWPAAGVLMTVAVWLQPRAVHLLDRQKSSGFLLPGLATGCGLGVLVIGTIEHLGPVALALAIGALVVAGGRLVWTAQGLQSLTEERHQQSMTDQLTGMGNRRYLIDLLDEFLLDQAHPQASARGLALLFVDLDHFKEINDSFGHLAGDELLKQIGPRFSALLGGSDVLVRFGGDEFAVVLVDADADYAASIARKLLFSLDEPFHLGGVVAAVSASIGIATAPTDAIDISGLLKCADVAMYRAKLDHTRFAFYDMHLDAADKWRLGNELRTAIEQHELVLHYQPQLCLESGEITGVEALVRWEHPKLGLLPPAQFLPLAEDAGLMPSLTGFVIDAALAQGSRWLELGRTLTVSVNISATNLLDVGFLDRVRSLFERHRFPPTSLILEITETTAIENFERSKFVIAELTELGVVVSIDDFGAGFTSLSHLASLAVRELKLDCALVTDLAAESRVRDRELVRSTIDLGHALGMQVVAEGIEDLGTLDLLRQLRCDFAQGYFISRPMPPDDVDFRFLTRVSVTSP